MNNHVPIYVISLSRTPERRLYIKRQLDALGLQYHFACVDEIDRYQLESRAYRSQIAESLEIDEALLENKYALMGSATGEHKGQLAIVLSHLKIYNLMLKKGYSEICILEDDANLLPTFPEVLKVAPKLSWDILQLAQQPVSNEVGLILKLSTYRPGRHFRPHTKKAMLSSLIKCWLRNHGDVDKQAVMLYGFDNRLYSQQSKYILKIIKEFRSKYRKQVALAILRYIIDFATMNPKRRGLVDTLDYHEYHHLWLHTVMQLGVPCKKDRLESITNDHCMIEPLNTPLSAMAYMVRPSAVAKLKQKLFTSATLAIDEAPWPLYQEGQAKLRVISPPCVTATHNYLKYSLTVFGT
ncbi:MAG: glycosyltransferase family 25 protein [Chromatiales bacterium]|nr:glycosyltransferase family 25 protein [Chromatiales bacterium]